MICDEFVELATCPDSQYYTTREKYHAEQEEQERAFRAERQKSL